MFSQKVTRKYISRIVCMVMFVLIQFDVFGYDLIYASICDVETSSVCFSDEDSFLNNSQEQCSEWSDPVYRNSSARLLLDLFYPVFIVLMFIWGNIVRYIRFLISNSQFNISDSQSYILFRALLI